MTYMKLGPVNDELFGRFPRYVGLVGSERDHKKRNQFVAFDTNSFQIFLDSNYGEHNLYTRTSHIGDTGRPVLDKAFFDLDVDKPDDLDETQKFDEMRKDRMVADEMLGDVVEDARELATYFLEKDWPAIAVYSGMGIHVHALTKPMVSPSRELSTTVQKVEDDLSLSTLDMKGAKEGDIKRLCRVANAPRIAEDGSTLSLYTIPLTLPELADITPEDLLSMSKSPRQVDVPKGDRPELQVYEEYETSSESGVVEAEAVEVADATDEIIEEQLEQFLKDALKMPCVYERLMSRNPDHKIRMQAAILMYNCGMTVDDVQDVYSRLGWFDYDQEVTREQLENIWREGYRSMSCQTIQKNNLCIYEQDEREDCSTFGWQGGQASW